MVARRYRSLHHNLQEGENVIFHREHRSKKNRTRKRPHSLQYLMYKAEKKYGKGTKLARI